MPHFLRKIRQPGRVFTLQALLTVLAVATAAFFIFNVHQLTVGYQKAGSLKQLWDIEWQSGKAFLDSTRTGFFQAFLLILGWSAYFRLRLREFSHIRLRRSEHKYRTIINHAGEAIFLLDQNEVVLEWNKAAEELFSLPRRTVLNNKLNDLHLDLNLDLGRAFADVVRTHRTLSYEVRLGPPGPGQRVLDLTVSCIRPDSGALAEQSDSFVVIARDITSQKQLETRMGETEKLAGIGQLAAGIAHQLNTPLGSILLSAQMVEEDVDDEDTAEDIRRIIRQTEQCRGIIKGLLNFARPTGSGRGRTNLSEVIHDTAYLMDKSLKVGGVELVVDEQRDSWVHGNRNEIEQVFFNLLANALDAMSDGGQIKVVITQGDPGEVLVRFSDTGEGISEEDLQQVFLPFFTTKDYGKGTGLGLSIVARIVHEHGGRIEVESAPGRGTTFLLTFPEARESSASENLIDDGD
jgi:PAS domain S-box-containing protein|nr:ATP-binding protein [Candidatus Krumholzibacteria bacterium]